jgi:hypothetical protein
MVHVVSSAHRPMSPPSRSGGPMPQAGCHMSGDLSRRAGPGPSQGCSQAESERRKPQQRSSSSTFAVSRNSSQRHDFWPPSRTSEKRSSPAAGGRCAAVGGTAERLPLSAKVPTRYTPGAKFRCNPPANRREAFEPIIPACAGEPAVRLHGWFVTGRPSEAVDPIPSVRFYPGAGCLCSHLSSRASS